MLIRIPKMLGEQQLQHVRTLLASARFVDGKLSAGMSASRVKHNEEVASDDTAVHALNDIIMGNLVRHPIYQNAGLPHRVAVPFYVRYTPGMRYGTHVDDPVMGPDKRYRSDIAITVFLNEPASYDGGELVVQTSFGTQDLKYEAGDAVMYPASSRHEVAEVTRGERLVAITWMQSLVRDPAKRELLYELNRAREKLLRKAPDAKETKQVDKTYVNLLRMWAEV